MGSPDQFCLRCGKRGTYLLEPGHTCAPEDLGDETKDDGFCEDCRGTGEGQFEGVGCSSCRGRGYTRVWGKYIDD